MCILMQMSLKQTSLNFFLIFKRALRNFIRTKDLKFTIICKKPIILGHNGSENAGLIPTALISLLVAKICG